MKGKGRDEGGGMVSNTVSARLARCRSEMDIASVGTRQDEGRGHEWLVSVSNKSPSPTFCIDLPEPFDLLSNFDDA